MIKLIVTIKGGVAVAASSNRPDEIEVIIDDRDVMEIDPMIVDEFESGDERNFDSLIESMRV